MLFGYNYNNESDYKAFLEYINEKNKIKFSSNTADEKHRAYKELDNKELQYFKDRDKREQEKQEEINKAVKETIENIIPNEVEKTTEKAIADIFSGFTKDIKINL